MTYRAKNPKGSSGLECSWRDKTNQLTLELLVESLSRREAIDGAIEWGRSDQGEEYWSNYYDGAHPDGEEEQHIRAMISVLALPSKPVNKEDWM